MQHDLQDQWRALVAEHQCAQEALTRAHQALNDRIGEAKAGGKNLRPLPEFLDANERAGEAVAKARRAMDRFKKEHPEVA